MLDTWTSNQRKFIEWLATPRYGRIPPTQELLAKELGVHAITLSKWTAKEGFRDAVTARSRELLNSRLPQIYGALAAKAESGDVPAIKLAMEMTGQHVDKVEQTGSVTYVVRWDESTQDRD